MNVRIIIHTENKHKLINLFNLILTSSNYNNFSICLHAKGYIPWEDTTLKQIITSFKQYYAYPTNKSKIESVVELVSSVKEDMILILDENTESFSFNTWSDESFDFLYTNKTEFLKLNLDTKYESFKWFMIDLLSQHKKTIYDYVDSSNDCVRYKSKIQSPLFNEKIIYIDGGMGDHVMALPLLERIQENVYVCCKYPFIYEHLKFKGVIDWSDELFGGYKRFVYDYGSKNKSKTIIDAFFEMYGYSRTYKDKLIYNGRREPITIENDNHKVALICSSAAKINNIDSNKDWLDIRWFKLVNELKNNGYFVIQVGTIKDNQIPNVDLKFLDKPISQLATLVEMSELWISVDTFFHHFAAAIKPEVGVCLTPFYNDHAKHYGVKYIEKDCGKDFSDRKWWLDSQQSERKECMNLIQVKDVLNVLNISYLSITNDYSRTDINNLTLIVPIYNNVDVAIDNIKKTINTSKYITQIIIYSNGTSDTGNQKLKDFRKTISIIDLHIVEKPIGYIKAINESIKLSRNELIICLNSDAVLFDNWENQLLSLCNDKNNGLVGPVMLKDFILGCCFVVRKSILNKIGMLNEGFGLGYEEDVELSNRVERNGYKLAFNCYKSEFDNKVINFPLNHTQGQSFKQFDDNFLNELLKFNSIKLRKFNDSKNVIVLKNLMYEEIKEILNDDDIFVVINKSGENFEKIRYDTEIIEKSHIFECTKEMNIDSLIHSITKGKNIKIINSKKEFSLTWLAKFDDYSSMGILSQKILENINCDVSCQNIIGINQTSNEKISNELKKPLNYDLGIMFSYPDMYKELNKFKTKVIYTGVDTTGGIANFVSNSNQADYLLTPSFKSKERMINLGVKKPIFVLPHGVDPQVFRYKPRVKSDKFRFLYVGECSDRKGIFQLLRVFTELFADNLNVELHIKSNNSMIFYNGEEIKNYIDKYKNIFWHISNEGHDKIIKLYDECDVYVYPSRADTFGMTILEAMACGLPVISTSEPGATELIKGRYFDVKTKLTPVLNHPWMLGEWGEPNETQLKYYMSSLYNDYDNICDILQLKGNSDFVINNYSWEKIGKKFETEILPKLKKDVKILTLLTSYNRPNHIGNIINSIKSIREDGYINDIYLVENTNTNIKNEVINIINNNIDDCFTVYKSDFNLGQRGALLQMLENKNIDDYDFIQFTDQDNIFIEPLSTYCNILNENEDIFFVTGYMSKEHNELGWRKTRFGNLCEKRSLRAGHMFLRVKDFKSLLPIHLDSQYNQPHNSSWNAGLDWELSYWNPNAPGRRANNNFVLCVPGGVLHVGLDSTMYNWDVEANEYKLEELRALRY